MEVTSKAYILKKMVNKERNLQVGKEQTSKFGNVSVVTNMKMDIVKAWSQRLGFSSFRSIQHFSEAFLKSSHPELFSVAMMQASTVNVRVNYTSFIDFFVKLHNPDCDKSVKYMEQSEWFADLLIAPSIKFAPVNYIGSTAPGVYDVNTSPFARIGFRIGWNALQNYKSIFRFNYGVETGPRPTIAGTGLDRFYFLIYIGMWFTMRPGKWYWTAS